MFKTKRILFLLPLLIIFIIGCSEDNTGVSELAEFNETEDNNSINSLISEEEGVVEEPRSYDDFEEPLEEIYPVHFGRQVTSKTVLTEIVYINEDFAEVTQTIYIEGIFHILTEDSLHIEKPFSDTGIRYFDIARIAPGNLFRGWRIVSKSGTEFWSDNNTVEITQLQITCEGIDTLITDISVKIPREDILTLLPGTEITLTVTTTNTDDELFLHRRFLHRRHFDSNGDGTYSITFITPLLTRPFRIGIDALSYETLFDDIADYDNNGWGIPLRTGY